MKYILSSLILTSILILTACSSVPTTNRTEGFSPSIQTKKVWTSRTSKGSPRYHLRLTPAVTNQTIFVPDHVGFITASEAHTGKMLWKIHTGNNLTSGIDASANKLFVATSSGEIIALQQTDGKQLWKTSVGNEILATPMATQGVVLAKSIDGSLTALSQKDGQQLWTYHQTVPSLTLHMSSQPKVANNIVIVGFSNGKVVALNLRSGKVNWIKTIAQPQGSTAIDRMTDIDVDPIIIGNIVYIATYHGNIMALNLYSGRTLWQHKISSHSGMVADSRNIYLSDAKSHIWAFDKKTGAVIWRQTELSGRKVTGPVLYNQYIIIADMKGYLHWLSKDNGERVAQDRLDFSGVITTPVVKNDIIYVYTRKGTLYTFKKA